MESVIERGDSPPVSLSLSEFLRERDFFIPESATTLIQTKLLLSERKAFLLRGPAGVGKTTLASLVAQYLDAETVFFQCTQGTSEEDLLYKYVPSSRSKSGITVTLGPLPLALSISKKRRVVLVIDEFDKTRPSADALLLDFLQNFRLSLYLSNKETVVTGNPNNLIVFITSNDMREFSEPLLRRVVQIFLSPLPTHKILEILQRHFREEIAVLLAQIYDDTINAHLRKPATVQELMELGEILSSNPNLDINTLIKSFIVKYDDDWERFTSYIAFREPYKFKVQEKKDDNNKDNSENKNNDISKQYMPQKPIEIEIRENEAKSDPQVKTSEILHELGKLTVKKVRKEMDCIKRIEDREEVCAKVEDNDFDAYTKIIQTFLPEPADDPTKLGKFIFVNDIKNFIISREPLSIKEVLAIMKQKILGEYYFEEETLLFRENINELIRNASKIRYYTNKLIMLECTTERNNEILLQLEMDWSGEIAFVTTRGYLKLVKEVSLYSDNLEKKVFDILLQGYEEYMKDFIPAELTSGRGIDPRVLPFVKKMEKTWYWGSSDRDKMKVYLEKLRNMVKALRKTEMPAFFGRTSSSDEMKLSLCKQEFTVSIGGEFGKITKDVLEEGKKYSIHDSIVDVAIQRIESALGGGGNA